MKFILKYASLIILFFLLIDKTKIYADFTASNSNIIILPLLIILIILNIIILYFYDFKKQNKFIYNNLVVAFLLILFGINLIFDYRQSKKEIKFQLYVPNNIMLKQIGYEIKLYTDNTFEISEYWHGESRHYFGKYSLKNNILIFNDEHIEDKTQDQITTSYYLNHNTKDFITLNTGYYNLKPHIR